MDYKKTVKKVRISWNICQCTIWKQFFWEEEWKFKKIRSIASIVPSYKVIIKPPSPIDPIEIVAHIKCFQ